MCLHFNDACAKRIWLSFSMGVASAADASRNFFGSIFYDFRKWPKAMKHHLLAAFVAAAAAVVVVVVGSLSS